MDTLQNLTAFFFERLLFFINVFKYSLIISIPGGIIIGLAMNFDKLLSIT